MMKGESEIVYGLRNKLQTTAANVLGAELLAKQYRKQVKPNPTK